MNRHAALRAFTLIELLVVISIIAIAMSMVFVLSGRKRDSMQIRMAADELAGVLRKTRNQAIEQKSFYAVAFNITNGKGTSGRVLNNHDGGHWYRVLGPTTSNWWSQGFTLLPSVNRGSAPGGNVESNNLGFSNRDYPVRFFLDVVSQSWESERHVLPKKSVRFLALTDQDNGGHCRAQDPYQQTYPRPWFGTWDAATGKWYSWGGYTPEIAEVSPFWGARTGLDGTATSSSGFFYEGAEGRVTGSVNPRDRLVWNDTDGNGFVNLSPNSDGAPSWPLLVKDQPRPLVNADWLDAMIIFYPDGRVDYRWFPTRHQFADRADWDIPQSFKKNGAHLLGMGDMTNVYTPQWAWEGNISDETSTYAARSGFFYITLGRDAADDRDTFATPGELINSLLPAVRVGINRYGEVKVVPVRRGLQPGQVLDPTAKGTWWNKTSPPICQDGYQGNVLGDAQLPVDDALTDEMLRNRQWWLE